MNEEEGKK